MNTLRHYNFLKTGYILLVKQLILFLYLRHHDQIGKPLRLTHLSHLCLTTLNRLGQYKIIRLNKPLSHLITISLIRMINHFKSGDDEADKHGVFVMF